MSVENLSTISSKIDSDSRQQSIRRSLPSKSVKEVSPPVRRHHSFVKNRPVNYIKKPSVPAIPEIEKGEEDDPPNLEKQDIASPDNVRISFTKRVKKTSSISRASKISVSNMERGYSNYGYDNSTRSSLHGSMSSLPVIREQYCCWARWTKMEKILAIVVAVLAVIIIILVIVIGFVAKSDNDTPRGIPFFVNW